MFLQRFYDERLAQASYLIGCQAAGEAIVIDPARDVAPYLEAAAREKLEIRFVTETHIHADFLSGSRELAARTGARLLLSAEGGEGWQYAYAAQDGARLLRGGDRFEVGNLLFEVLHTPGHTPEHLAFLLTDLPAGAGPIGVFTGDFVFAGDVGRPDLLERAAGYADTMRAGAADLFRSLQRFRQLPDHLQIWPGHGAGSACGKALGAVPSSTLGYEKRANWAFRIGDEATFVNRVLEGQPDPPRYFAQMKRLNKSGPPLLAEIAPPVAGTAASLGGAAAAARRGGRSLVDLRPAADFATGHLAGSVNLPLDRGFVTWAGWLLPYDRPIDLLGSPGACSDARQALASIGLDRVETCFDAALLESRGGRLETIGQISAAALAAELAGPKPPLLLDVRWLSEWQTGHISGARHAPLGYLREQIADMPEQGRIVVQCASGARSSIAASLLQAAGRGQVTNLEGGIQAWRAGGHPLEETPEEGELAAAGAASCPIGARRGQS